MSRPRQVLPGATYLVTRRCARREFLLRPSPTVNAIVRYVLAVAARKFAVRIHAFCVLSNHLHIVLTDPYARLPAFEQYLNSLIGRAVNASLGRWEDFWAPNTYSAVVLLTPEDVVSKIAYVLSNPVAAGLVLHGWEWPGLWSSPESMGGEPIDADRPKHFFKSNGAMPPSAQLWLRRPAGFDSAADFDARLRSALAELEAKAARQLEAEGRSFLGVAGVLSQHPAGKPAAIEPRRGLSPRVASRDKWKRIEGLTRLAEFAAAYREALTAWRRGFRDTLFPPGTYQLRLFHGVRCAPAG